MLLDGVRVISLCHYLQGPAAAQYLADLGAEVIKLEPPKGAYERHWSGADVFVGGVSGFYLAANRNKQSVCLNLKSESGRQAFLKLVATADVVMENFRPGTLDKLGLSESVLKSVKPDLIYASASGFGSDGPYAKLPGQDLLIQARTGLVAATAGQQPNILPAAAGCAVVDQHGAALFAMGIVAALFRKERTGAGTRVESSLFNAGIDLQQESIVAYINGHKTPGVFRRGENLATWFHEAPYGIYETRDGHHLALSLNPLDTLASALNEARESENAPGAPASFARDGSPLDRQRDRDEICARVAAALAEVSYAAAERALSARSLWFAPVNSYSELVADPQARHNGVFMQVEVKGETAVLVAHPNRYDGKAPGVRHIAETAGADGTEILRSAGLSDEEIAALQSEEMAS
ncbi:MAG: CoA transferase [Hyphomicrobiaceae bacterium]|nr:CoA transferase [Hyphomicrobiaceae bacterium]